MRLGIFMVRIVLFGLVAICLLGCNKYLERLVDKRLDLYLSTFGAVCVEGPKSLAVIVGKSGLAYRREEDGVYVLPITALRA